MKRTELDDEFDDILVDFLKKLENINSKARNDGDDSIVGQSCFLQETVDTILTSRETGYLGG